MTGKTTSTTPSVSGTAPLLLTISSLVSPGEMLTSRSPTTLGSRPPSPSSSGFAFGPSSTQLPVVLMPIGNTSYFSRSIAFRTLLAEKHEHDDSLETPPHKTETSGLRRCVVSSGTSIAQLQDRSLFCSAS